MDREDEIRLIAYSIWEENAYCDGHHLEHWLKAEAIWEERNRPRGVDKQADKTPQYAGKQVKSKKGRRSHK
jgi:hypothetical protein